jgi:phosphoribosylanthranilate isomerase
MQVKICGMTHPDDAHLAATLGADYIGVIFSPLSKRVVTVERASEIQSVIRDTKTQLVGVFVDESAEEIEAICTYTAISIVQLHGKKSQQAVSQLSKKYTIFYVMMGDQQHQNFSKNIIPLFDQEKSDKNNSFDWHSFIPPQTPWILAGGLTVENVSRAIRLLRPTVVDVARGVEQSGLVRKDDVLMKKFIDISKGVKDE